MPKKKSSGLLRPNQPPKRRRRNAKKKTEPQLSDPEEKRGTISADFFNAKKTGTLTVNPVKEKLKKNQIECDSSLPQPPFLLPIVAPRKSGKTNLLLDSLLDEDKYCRKFDIVVIWSRTYHHDSKWKNINAEEVAVFTTFKEDEVHTLMNIAEMVARKVAVNVLFIFDDMITDGIMNPHKMGTLESIAVRGRHANVSIIIITQQYMALSPSVRNNSTNSIFFRIRNGDELEKIARENRESLTRDEFLELYNYATSEPYCFLHVNNQEADPKKRFYKNWNTSLELV